MTLHTDNIYIPLQEIPLISSPLQAKFFINVLAEPAEVVRNQNLYSFLAHSLKHDL